MKALVLAGGSGTRLRPISHAMPKQLVPVANKPVLVHALETIRDAQITDVGMVVGDTAPAIHAAIGDGADLGLRIRYLPQDAPRGLAHAVLIARDHLGDDDFLMYLGDNVLLGGLAEIVDTFTEHRPDSLVTVTKVADPRHYGIAEIGAGDRVVRLVEKPSVPASDLAMTGVYLFTPAVHEAVRGIRPGHRGELQITDAIQWLVDHGGDVRAHVFDGYWKDTGQIEDLLDCNRVLLQTRAPAHDGVVDAGSRLVGHVVLEAGARVHRSRIAGPAVVGADAVVSDSDIQPFTSIGARCTISSSTVGNSIIMAGTTLHTVRDLESSVVGRSTRITSGGGRRRHRVVAADDTWLEL
jgi:glucose-1-phosphate thymidylyltransferase